jgi:RNA polymerase sigma factor (sigma-70 family)
MSVFLVIKSKDYSELVDKAANGDKEALSKLAETVHGSLKSYVLRITLSADAADEIVQETIVEMYKIFGQLKNKDSFWPWLCKIALNKVRSSSTKQTRQRQLLEKHAEELSSRKINIEGLTNAINKEVKQAILQSMSKLNDQQKAILSLRCFENLPFSKIAYVMDLSEFNSRVIFHRAKKKLQKHLCHSGFTKKNLLPALIIFGKLTAPSEAAASSISISQAMLGAGGLATAVATATTKTAIILTAGGAIALGVATNSVVQNAANTDHDIPSYANSAASFISVESDTSIEGYYYYPNGSSGPVITRLTVSAGDKTCKVLQNDHGNYIQAGSGVVLRNQHYWNRDLSVMTLPADNKQLSELLGNKQFGSSSIPASFSRTQNLLFASSMNQQTNSVDLSVHKYDAMMEESFQYNWPSGATVTDQRDDMHKQGWCYVSMKGSFKEQKITGMGRIPFTYTASRKMPAAMTINIGKDIAISVSDKSAVMESGDETVTTYPAGTFFMGINKPWMGLHCIDTIRRDAALNGIRFKTEPLSDKTKCKVSLHHNNSIIEYMIDTNKDLIDEISFRDGFGDLNGHITFEYSMTRPGNYNSLKVPAGQNHSRSKVTMPIHWLADLVSEKF